jgi:hypothetical protein
MNVFDKWKKILFKEHESQDRKDRKLLIANNRKVTKDGKVYILIKGGMENGRL